MWPWTTRVVLYPSALRSMLLSTDRLPRAVVRIIEQTWGCDVYDHYGATEMGLGGGVDCRTRTGYHLREADLFFITENGYGKRTNINAFKNINRGGKGVICIQTGERNGNLVTAREVVESDELMIITMSGMIIRCPVSGVRVVGRATKGVRIINLKDGDKVVDVAMIAADGNGNGDSEDNGEEAVENDETETGMDEEGPEE